MSNDGLINIALESFLVHARNLLQFFYDKVSKKGSRSCAHHFINNWEKICPSKTEDVKKLYGKVSDEVHHLSYKREAKENKVPWNDVELLHNFMEIVKLFNSHLDPKYKTKEFKKWQKEY